MDQLLHNSIITPDGTELVSEYTHDFKSHKDANGHTYSVDGGKSYSRRLYSVDAPPYTDNNKYLCDDHEYNREWFNWGSYGKDGNSPHRYIKLKDMETDHILAIIGTQDHVQGTYVEELLLEELKFRGKKNPAI